MALPVPDYRDLGALNPAGLTAAITWNGINAVRYGWSVTLAGRAERYPAAERDLTLAQDVASFQANRNLEEDGKLGPQTIGAMQGLQRQWIAAGRPADQNSVRWRLYRWLQLPGAAAAPPDGGGGGGNAGGGGGGGAIQPDPSGGGTTVAKDAEQGKWKKTAAVGGGLTGLALLLWLLSRGKKKGNKAKAKKK